MEFILPKRNPRTNAKCLVLGNTRKGLGTKPEPEVWPCMEKGNLGIAPIFLVAHASKGVSSFYALSQWGEVGGRGVGLEGGGGGQQRYHLGLPR